MIVSSTAINNEITVSNACNTDLIDSSPSICETAPDKYSSIRQNKHSIRTGRNIQADAIITNIPVPLFSIERLPLNVLTVSLRTLPTTGTNEFIANLTALVLTSSMDEVTKLCEDKIVTKKQRKKLSIHLRHLLMAEHIPVSLREGEREAVTDKDKNTLIKGTINLEDIRPINSDVPINVV